MTMKAVTMTQFGAPSVLTLSSLPCPEVSDEDVLIKVHYAGVNRPDIAQRQGVYPPPPGTSEILGLEVAGDIVECGSKVQNWKIGDKVCALLPGGGYADYAKAHQNCVLPLPTGFDYCQAAALPETIFTVWSNVFDQGQLKKGEVFLVHGGTSGIGSIAIQMAKAFGATVITTAGNPEKCAACTRLGADLVIPYKEKDFCQEVLDFTQNQGANVILDMIGGDYVNKNYKAAAKGGRILQIAFLNGNLVQINLNYLMRKKLWHTGSTLRGQDDSFKGKIRQQLLEKVWPLLNNGKIAPVIDSIFTLEDAHKAHQKMEESQHIGKIMLKVF